MRKLLVVLGVRDLGARAGVRQRLEGRRRAASRGHGGRARLRAGGRAGDPRGDAGPRPARFRWAAQTVNVGVKAIALQVTSYADACGDFASSQCRFHQNAQSVTVLFARLNPLGTEPGARGRDVHGELEPHGGDPPDGAPASSPSPSPRRSPPTRPASATRARRSRAARSGSTRSAGPITGHLSLTFQDGSTLEGDFSAPLCTGPSPDVCALATAQALCTLPPLCQP